MKIALLKVLSVAGVCLALTSSTFAQYNSFQFNQKTHKKTEKLKLIQRVEIGFHSAFQKTSFHNEMIAKFPYFDGGGAFQGFNEASEATVTRLKNANIGGNIGVTIPVGRIAPKTSLGFNIDVYATMSTYEFDNFTVWGMPAKPTLTLKSTTINIPLGFDMKWGGQSTLSKDDWASVGIGGGIAPTIVMMNPKELSDNSKMTVRPYVKAEFGFHTGIFWKIKGMVLFNNMTLGEVTTGDINNVTDQAPYVAQSVKTNTHTYMLGLSVNIGSTKWSRSW